MRFVAEGATITTSFARLGLIAGDGVPWLLPRVVGTERIAELQLASRTITAGEAGSTGLVRAVTPSGEALSWALAVIMTQLHEDAHLPGHQAMQPAVDLVRQAFE